MSFKALAMLDGITNFRKAVILDNYVSPFEVQVDHVFSSKNCEIASECCKGICTPNLYTRTAKVSNY